MWVLKCTLSGILYSNRTKTTELSLCWSTSVPTHTAAKIRGCDYVPTESAVSI